jgi:lipoprotein NlpI
MEGEMGIARWHWAAGACLAAALWLGLGPASAEQSQNWKWCVNKNNAYSPDLAISGCTAFIHSGRENRKNLAAAFNNRGIAYDDKKDFDRALADYNEAIRLNPKDAHAFNNRGVAYDNKKEYDRAIADYDAAIRLNSKLAAAFNNRGNAYRAKKDYDRAIADYNEAIRLDPKYAEAFNNRGRAYRAKKDYDHAIADYDAAIRLDPKHASAYLNRGLAYLYGDLLAKAQADFKEASELDPKDAYAALWLDLTERRNNIPSHLAQAATPIDMKTWPAPVIRLFLGELTPEAVLAAADDPNPITKQGQVCEANFYSGERALQDGSKEAAARLFRTAVDGCPRDFMEWFAANAELKALGLKP